VLNKRSLGLMAVITLTASLLVVAALHAGTVAPAEIKLEAPYPHEEGIVVFTHQKHSVDHKIACGECHHDEKGQPRQLKEGDEVKQCFECHNKPGELKGKKAKGLSKSELILYEGNAMHDTCIDCHRKYNRENKTKAAPTTCNDCHPRKKK
jgi:hypothetical protein